jgi:L-ascorbate metabolism protein UlaG (beta-lactamase superfamily)
MNYFFIILFSFLIPSTCPAAKDQLQGHDFINIRYLGHSCFCIDFGGEISLVTDYGKPDAYKEYGWSSPIRSIGEISPDILTYSHMHDDHYDAERVEKCKAIKYFGDTVFYYNGLSIQPIDFSEKDINTPDTHAYLFKYRDMKVLHLGDCQANIISVNDQSNRRYLMDNIPDDCQVIFVPVEGPTQFTGELKEFFQLLDTEVIVPMHYWSEAYKDSLLIELSASEGGWEYDVVELPGNSYTYDPEKKQAGTRILDFSRGS